MKSTKHTCLQMPKGKVLFQPRAIAELVLEISTVCTQIKTRVLQPLRRLYLQPRWGTKKKKKNQNLEN